MNLLKNDEIAMYAPTLRPSEVEEFHYGKLKISCYDVGGHTAVRGLWREWLVRADAIVFVVDRADGARLDEAGIELNNICVATADEQGDSPPILIREFV